jgi:hypothetical protein
MLLVIGGRLPSTQCHKDTWGNKSTIGVVPAEVSGREGRKNGAVVDNSNRGSSV